VPLLRAHRLGLFELRSASNLAGPVRITLVDRYREDSMTGHRLLLAQPNRYVRSVSTSVQVVLSGGGGSGRGGYGGGGGGY